MQSWLDRSSINRDRESGPRLTLGILNSLWDGQWSCFVNIGTQGREWMGGRYGTLAKNWWCVLGEGAAWYILSSISECFCDTC